jgi:hypothetical protein
VGGGERREESGETPDPAMVVSCPELGSLSPDGGGPYDQAVMTKLMEMQSAGLLKIAFDRAGTSTASEEDRHAFVSPQAICRSL